MDEGGEYSGRLGLRSSIMQRDANGGREIDISQMSTLPRPDNHPPTIMTHDDPAELLFRDSTMKEEKGLRVHSSHPILLLARIYTRVPS